MALSNGVEEHFLVIVPGYMGSLLRDRNTGEMIWLDIPAMLKNPSHIDDILSKLKYPNEDLEPAGLMESGILYALPWGKLDHYGRLLEHLRRRGFLIDPPVPDPARTAVYRFAYDWRQDNRISARQLRDAVRGWRERHGGAKAWIIGHSNGGIVSRWYIEKEGGKEDVSRLFLMGSPWDGAPKSLRVLFEGYDIVGRRLLNLFGFTRLLNEIIRTFPSYYQLIPHTTPFLTSSLNQPVDPFENGSWLLEERDRRHLLDGLAFNRELGNELSVETICYFGRMKPTTTSGVIEIGPGGQWEKIAWVDTGSGDGTVPERSAIHPKAKERHAFAVDHGNIYIDPQVLAQLDFDLSGGVAGLDFASLVTENLSIEFDTDADFYSPGQPVELTATVKHRDDDSTPVMDALVAVTIKWREPLPGDAEPASPVQPFSLQLEADPAQPGIYQGRFPAPALDGSYTLLCYIQAPLLQPIEIEETIAVEQVPEMA